MSNTLNIRPPECVGRVVDRSAQAQSHGGGGQVLGVSGASGVCSALWACLMLNYRACPTSRALMAHFPAGDGRPLRRRSTRPSWPQRAPTGQTRMASLSSRGRATPRGRLAGTHRPRRGPSLQRRARRIPPRRRSVRPSSPNYFCSLPIGLENGMRRDWPVFPTWRSGRAIRVRVRLSGKFRHGVHLVFAISCSGSNALFAGRLPVWLRTSRRLD